MTAVSPEAHVRSRLWRCSLLVFGSGFCALVYQIAWQRLFRLIFGASTEASAAVVAIFMAGLGYGSVRLGRRADGQQRPLAFYARLEGWIALGAIASPLLLLAVEPLYFGLGGAARLGLFAGSLVRLLCAALILGLPTFFMGGTLPAIARAVEQDEDHGRRRLALLYGVNTLGAVAGALVATFLLLESLGNRGSVWFAGCINLIVAGTAFVWAMTMPADLDAASAAPVEAHPEKAEKPRAKGKARPAALPEPPREEPRTVNLRLVLAAAGLVGFAFFLVELVWYRMLAPVLGGSSYTFGLILATALAGIGLGGCLYSLGGASRRPTLAALAGTCGLEALFLLVPYALGDRLAVLAMLLRPLGNLHFGLLVGEWSVITAAVVLPPSIVAGYQFPLLVGLLGRGRRDVGREVGLAYAANTAGAIVGSLAGGFGLLPALGATGAWKLDAILLLVLQAVVLAWALRSEKSGWRPLVLPVTAAALALAMLGGRGPTAAWRHNPIGAGRAATVLEGLNDLREKVNARRHSIVWEADGVESAIALKRVDDFELIINGKSDGSAFQDAPTQVMSPLVAAMLHPNPRRGLVIGLGTGSSSGWLAQVPTIEHVDTVEIEPVVRRIAEAMADVNRRVLEQPKVELLGGDGREFLLATRRRYDIIFSEPSNPYRAGVSSLFTREFYAAAAEHLESGGLFAQWMQGYDIDAGLVGTVYATIHSVFDHVETWQVGRNDLLLVASRTPIVHDLERVRQRATQSPYREALRDTWGVEGAEGFYSGYVAAPAFAAGLPAPPQLNTDDRQIIEFGFARNLGRQGLFDANSVRQAALSRKQNRPPGLESALDWRLVTELTAARNSLWGSVPAVLEPGDTDFEARVKARHAYSLGNLAAAAAVWGAQGGAPRCPFDLTMIAESLGDSGMDGAASAAETLRPYSRAAAEVALARLAHHQGDRAGTADHLERAFAAAREDPWIYLPMMRRAIQLASTVGKEDAALGARLYAALATPFPAGLVDELRLRARLEIAGVVDFGRLCREALRPFEPDVPWEERFLIIRQGCYQQIGSPLEPQARRELEEYRAGAPPRLGGDAGGL
jgi:spermidine synthase/MFS family permease